MRNKIKIIIAQALGLEIADVGESQRLHEDLGLDDADLDQIMLSIKDQTTTEIPTQDLSDIYTVGELLDLVEQYVPEEI